MSCLHETGWCSHWGLQFPYIPALYYLSQHYTGIYKPSRGTRNQAAQEEVNLILWRVKFHVPILSAIYILGVENYKLDFLSHQQLSQREWAPHPEVFRALYWWGTLDVDLLVSRFNAKVIPSVCNGWIADTMRSILLDLFFPSVTDSSTSASQDSDGGNDSDSDCTSLVQESMLFRQHEHVGGVIHGSFYFVPAFSLKVWSSILLYTHWL